MDRRKFLSISAAFAAFAPNAARANAKPQLGEKSAFSVDILQARAKALSTQAYAPRPMVPQAWRDMNYDEYRTLWFNSQRALWAGEDKAIEVDFFHPGLYFPRPVGISVVENGQARPIAFDLALFDRTDKSPDLPIDDTLGYSGLRLRAELENPGVHQEFAVFQGASYFRALAQGQVYGLSARGLALNTADKAGEEFPEFTDFWIETPAEGSSTTTIHALLDSPSVTGAYTLVIQPGLTTTMDVTARLFPRKTLSHVGLGALTSMFLFDETNTSRFDDFRPQVHDSDGLMIHNGAGEVLWRTLANPTQLQVSSFVDNNPRGFGLMRRSRAFSDFADLEAHYHKRPSLWVEPKGDWGKGAVTLVEIPADREIYDNIVAYWRPRSAMQAGQAHDIAYTLQWGDDPALGTGTARVLNSRMGKRFAGGYIAMVDFEDSPGLPEDLSELTILIRSNTGTTSDGILQRNPDTGGPRLGFSFDPQGANAVELRTQLFHNGTRVSEVWLYRWTA